MRYQDNYFCDVLLKKNCVVAYVSNPEAYVDGKLNAMKPERINCSDGLELVRLKRRFIFSRAISVKLGFFKNLYCVINDFRPDIIYCHNFQYSSILDVVKYKKKHQNVKVFVDTHCAKFNSARNFASKIFLHKMLYNYLSKKISKIVEKVFYVGESEKEFALEHYSFSPQQLEFLPQGGVPLNDEEYICTRTKYRKILGVDDKTVVFLHSGKIDSEKRTKILLSSFISCPDLQAKLVIIGSFEKSCEQELMSIISSDKRILFLGWKSGEELQNYLCAADVYCQPGSVSATLQNAICQRCAVMSYPHQVYLKSIDYGQFIWVSNEEDIEKAFLKIKNGIVDLIQLKNNSIKCANTMLDYKVLLERILI